MWSCAYGAVEEVSKFLLIFFCALASYDPETLVSMWSCTCLAGEEESEFLKFSKFLVHDDPILYTTGRGGGTNIPAAFMALIIVVVCPLSPLFTYFPLGATTLTVCEHRLAQLKM